MVATTKFGLNPVPAKLVTSDRKITLLFDAAPALLELTANQVEHMAREERWEGEDKNLALATHIKVVSQSGVMEAMRHARSLSGAGYSVTLDKTMADGWLALHHPQIHASLLNIPPSKTAAPALSNTVVQVGYPNHGETVVRDINAAVLRIAHGLLPAEKDRDLKFLSLEEVCPKLLAVGYEPSLAYRVRNFFNARGEKPEFVVHELDRLPNHSTSVWSYNFGETFDPGYELYKALAHAEDTEEPLSDVVYDMMEEAKAYVASENAFLGSDLINMKNFSQYHQAFGGPDLLGSGTPAEVFQALPLRMANAFTDIAAKAYPDEAKELQAYMKGLNRKSKAAAPAP